MHCKGCHHRENFYYCSDSATANTAITKTGATTAKAAATAGTAATAKAATTAKTATIATTQPLQGLPPLHRLPPLQLLPLLHGPPRLQAITSKSQPKAVTSKRNCLQALAWGKVSTHQQPPSKCLTKAAATTRLHQLLPDKSC